MATVEARPKTAPRAISSSTRAALWLVGATLLALVLYYFIGFPCH